jgi:hypothetical protein
MIELLNKLLPLMLFWILAATYFGGWAVELRGGRGPQQVIGLLLSGVLFIVTWELLHRVFLTFGEVLGGIVITTFITAALLPALGWVGFKMVGVTVARSSGAHGH